MIFKGSCTRRCICPSWVWGGGSASTGGGASYVATVIAPPLAPLSSFGLWTGLAVAVLAVVVLAVTEFIVAAFSVTLP